MSFNVIYLNDDKTDYITEEEVGNVLQRLGYDRTYEIIGQTVHLSFDNGKYKIWVLLHFFKGMCRLYKELMLHQ